MRATVVVVLAAIVALTAPPAMAGTLDQEQSQHDGSQELHGAVGGTIAQTFTAGRTGLMDRVELLLADYAGGYPMDLSLRRVGSDGKPGEELAAESIEYRDRFGIMEWVGVAIDPPLYVRQGFRYGLVARTRFDYRFPWFWAHQSGDPYASGDAWTDRGNGWVPEPLDRTFRTFIDGQPDCAVVRAVVNDRLVCV